LLSVWLQLRKDQDAPSMLRLLSCKPKCRCIYISYEVRCDKEPTEGNKYCAEHIEPQCGHITLPLGRQCKNKVYAPGERNCKQCKKEEEEYEEEIRKDIEIERIKRERHQEALNFDSSQIINQGKPFTLNAMKLLFG